MTSLLSYYQSGLIAPYANPRAFWPLIPPMRTTSLMHELMTDMDSSIDIKPIDTDVSELLVRVGGRVRRAREERGLPRRVLSELSGVSPRYLALLESGEGNISIGLLMRVAVSLDKPIDWLVSDPD